MAHHLGRKKRILIVEDDDAWARLISDEVADVGFDPVRARSVEEAQERLNGEPGISLVVMDVLFGKKLEPRGIEFALSMKKDQKLRDIPIVFCSVVGRGEIGACLNQLKTGHDIVFEKPFDFKEFADKIKTLVGEDRE